MFKGTFARVSFLTIFLASVDAHAELAHVLDTIPKPHQRIMFDNSVTMDINVGCTNCHAPPTRLTRAREALLETLPLMENYFVFSGARYAGCGRARVVESHLPNFDDPGTSYNNVFGMVAGAQACQSKERTLGNAESRSVLTPGNVGATTIIDQLAHRQLAGFDPLRPFRHEGCHYTQFSGGQGDFDPCLDDQGLPVDALYFGGACYHVGCDDYSTDSNGDGSTLDPPDAGDMQAAISLIAGLDWPHWVASDLTADEVQAGLCDPVAAVIQPIYDVLSACPWNSPSGGIPGYPGANTGGYFDQPGVGDIASWCDAGTIANNACRGGSPLNNTCVCNDESPGCLAGSQAAVSACGNTLQWKARQQVAVCNTYEPNVFSSMVRPDNVVTGGCRENSAIFLTDGYMGDTGGVSQEALGAHTTFGPNPVYRSPTTGFSNLSVFRLSNVFGGEANVMMREVSDGHEQNAFDATNVVNMQASFSELINRAYKGVYNGAGIALDDRGTRLAIHSFTVPGYNVTPPSEDYLGWPARISWHAISEDGVIDETPVFQTDETALFNAQAPGCGRRAFRGPYPAGINANIPTDQNAALAPTVNQGENALSIADLGPGGSFRNGVDRTIGPLVFTDRNGDGLEEAHPPVTYGRMFSMAATKPVVVEAGQSIVNGGDRMKLQQHIQSIEDRPRMIYTWSNGQLLSFFGGSRSNNAQSVGYENYRYQYDDGAGYAGAEVIRYEPGWVNNSTPQYSFTANALIQQPITTGELAVREAMLRTGNGANDTRWATLLVGAQGQSGRGLFTMDISNPCAPTLLGEWTMPAQARTSAEPSIVMFPTNIGAQAGVVMPGGLGGPPMLYAYDFRGNLIDSIGLPADEYPSAPVCADVTGEGNVSHCYVLGSSGRVVRVSTDSANGGFATAYDITPPNVMGGGRVFSSSPAGFFDVTGALTLVFGSGNFRELDRGDGIDNHFYKVIDRAVRSNNPNQAADLARACDRGPRISGDFALQPNERVIAAPSVNKGVVAWTTYTPGTNGCIAGTAQLYTMNFATCSDANNGAPSPVPVPLGEGLPSTPNLHRPSQSMLAGTSAGPTAAQTSSLDVRTRGDAFFQVTKRFWRPVLDTR